MNQNTIACLLENGWSEDRVVEVAEITEILERNDWNVFEVGLSFISSFDGLPEFNYNRLSRLGFSKDALSFVFRYSTGLDWRESAKILELKLGILLLPIGHQDLFEMFIGSDSCIYSIDADMT